MISFVIPTLNESKTIMSTINSIKPFSRDHEIIISDGNSRDDTLALCCDQVTQVVIHDKPTRQTIAMARNVGAAVAQGNYIVFVDADVIIPDIDDFFETALKEFRSRSDLVALTVKYRVTPEVSTFFDRGVFTMLGLQFFLQNNVFRIGAAGGEFQMVTAEAFRRVGGFDERLVAAEDMDLFRRLSRIGRTRFVNSLTIFHTGRRAHAVGWPRLLWQWFINSVSVYLFRKSVSREWEEVR
ncbi:glycosyltransferase [Mycobacterium sp. AT1]|uniref:glycosyltransferase n=1 Tax=Mycobacterium sp. AT1 TaxID=1961706 RepID=UPI0009AD559B|nr:glycosyltransferase [Mycobacterium sp. AT1]OPX08643.1 hypothetical protein B1790_18540 [Mycobacterium sp. AT1]